MNPVLGILGGGWLGQRAEAHFQEKYEVRVTHRSGDFALDLNATSTYLPALAEVQILFITAPLHRIPGHKHLPEILGEFKGQIFYCSTTGIYPSKEGHFREEDAEEGIFLAVENFLRAYYPQTCVLRLGGLMGDGRYLAKFYKDKPMPQPGARVNYIHYEDILGVLEVLFLGGQEGETFNVVAPLHPRKREVYYSQTGLQVNGEDFNRTVNVDRLIQKTGYRFRHPDPLSFPYIRSL